ncbi:mannose-6-phosphate isomerase, class I, partial [bacterium]|nr:mannose-6-phosphate isomerase, class I [bacterium]
MEDLKQPYRLINRMQHYDWGTRDAEAFIPGLLGMIPKKGKPYAELWIGTHPKAPSRIEWGGKPVSVQSWIAQNPGWVLGPAVADRFGGLPYLLKVVSAAEPLSIQAHPDKKLAERLHAANPTEYPDDNHKPEIAIALNG